MYSGMDPTKYNRHLKNVAVIVSVNPEGKMVPLYFRYCNKDYKIDRLASSNTDCEPYYRYACELTRGESVHRVELVCNIRTQQWMLDLERCM